MFEANHLTRYYAAVDAGDFSLAAAALAPDVTFAIHLPAGASRGSTSGELIDYLSGRGDVDRAHHPLRTGVDGDLEFVYGEVTQDGATTGSFLAAVRVRDGLIDRYQVSFDPELSLLQEAP
ncbi:nuclear transport factor 2 family protein [Nocardioides zeae]|uniref:Nuclear transport factor 2 family protein n=1 Tax=Nocardioides imazamoxiresistens TaxID=3231893 RepID=A0ABU3PVI8_9ACTN|nr:nuclear transport factor 2 family protein [Nocardioides zeae]MDT9593259.1 nuclear transport factor 2 family protein [Nocardioides zeae]